MNKNSSSKKNIGVITAELVRNRVIVWDYELGSKLYNSGFFGKPIGIRKPKGDNFERPLELSLIEACYLIERNKIKVYGDNEHNILTYKNLYKLGKKHIQLFEEKVLIYNDIRKRGLVPRPGLKFGADFAVYKHGPGIDHSPYVISTMQRGVELSAVELVRAGRLATSVRKKFVIATILDNDEIRYYGFVWNKP